MCVMSYPVASGGRIPESHGCRQSFVQVALGMENLQPCGGDSAVKTPEGIGEGQHDPDPGVMLAQGIVLSAR